MLGLKKNEKHLMDLRKELEKLENASLEGNYNVILNSDNLSTGEVDVIQIVQRTLNNYKHNMDYNLMKYQLTSNALGIALWDMDVVGGDPINPHNRFTWSQEFRTMLGFKDEHDFPNVLSSWSDRIHPDDKERSLDAFAAHLNDRTRKTPYDLINRIKLKNGTYRHFRAFGSTLRDKDGLALKVAGALQDITEEVETQSQMEMERNELKNNNLRLELLTTSMHIALWDMMVDPSDPTGSSNEFWWSQEFRKMLGFTDEKDFPNILSSWSDRIHPDDKEKTLGDFALHLNDRSGKVPYDVKNRIMLKNGEYRHFHAFGSTMRDSDGTPLRVAGAIKDITEEQEMLAKLNTQDQLNESNRRLQKLMTEIEVVSRNVSEGSRQVSDSSQNLAQGASTQTSAIEELNTGIEMMRQQINNSAQNATNASNLSSNARQNAFYGNEEMKAMLLSMQEIEQASSNIAQIIKTIEGIAFQTNLLALNAAVEAARAGSHGKGFAVVAEEVRSLAGRSQVASRETNNIIIDIASKVKNGTEIAEKTAKTLETIVVDFDTVTESVKEIASSSNEQQASIEHIVIGIAKISNITQSNTTASQETASASEELASQAEALIDLLKNP